MKDLIFFIILGCLLLLFSLLLLLMFAVSFIDTIFIFTFFPPSPCFDLFFDITFVFFPPSPSPSFLFLLFFPFLLQHQLDSYSSLPKYQSTKIYMYRHSRKKKKFNFQTTSHPVPPSLHCPSNQEQRELSEKKES